MLWVHSLTPTCLLCWSCLFAVDLGEASVYSIISNNIIGLLKCPVDVSNSRYSRQFAIKAPINLNTAALSQVNNAAWHSWAFKTVRAAQRRRQSECLCFRDLSLWAIFRLNVHCFCPKLWCDQWWTEAFFWPTSHQQRPLWLFSRKPWRCVTCCVWFQRWTFWSQLLSFPLCDGYIQY